MKKPGFERDSRANRSNSLKHLSEDELLDVFETARRRSPRAAAPLAWIIHDFTGKKRKGALKD
jgi:hypothetical protein